MQLRVVGVGAGGHAKVVMDILESLGGVDIVGLLDTNAERWNTDYFGVPVLGGDELLGSLRRQGVGHFFVGVGSVGDTSLRRLLYEKGVAAGLQPIAAIHPRAVVSRHASLGLGATVLAGAVINAGARIGDNVVVNTGALVEHDCTVEDHAYVSTGACLAGGVHVGAGAHIGNGASVRQCVRIGKGAVVATGAVVVKDVADGVTVMGVPALPK